MWRSRAKRWSSLELHNNRNNFQFAIVTDNTGGARGVFEDAVAKLNLIEPEFVMSVGDLIQGYSSDHEKIDKMWSEFAGHRQVEGAVLLRARESRRLSNKTMKAEWQKQLDAYYHFRYRDVLFVPQQRRPTSRRGGSISADQLTYVKKVLKENSDVLPDAAVPASPGGLAHPGSKAGTPLKNCSRPQVQRLRRSSARLRELRHARPSVRRSCDDGRRGSCCCRTIQINEMRVVLGSFDEIAWVTMTDNGPQITGTTGLDGIWASDLRTPETAGWTRSLLRQIPVYLAPDSDEREKVFAERRRYAW